MEHLWCYNFHSRVFFGYVVYQCATGHKINDPLTLIPRVFQGKKI